MRKKFRKHFDISQDVQARLELYCHDTGKKQSELFRELLREFLYRIYS